MIKYDDMMMYEKGENSIMFSHLNHKNLFLNIRKIENELTVDSLVSFFCKKEYNVLNINKEVLFDKKSNKILFKNKEDGVYMTIYLIDDMKVVFIYDGGRDMQEDFVNLLDNIKVVNGKECQ